MAVYQFGASTFSSNIMINQGNTFSTPLSVVIDPDGTVDIAIEVIDFSGGSGGGTVNTGEFSSSVNFPIDHLTSSGGQYQIRLRNRNAPVTISLNGGSVYY